MKLKAIGIAIWFLFTAACSQQEEASQAETTTPVEAQTTDTPAASVAASPTPKYEITNITGDLYRASKGTGGGHATVFLVTPEGIILGDPLGIEFAEWLKAELAERFSSTVKYILYSHHHFDHASGGYVFADTARAIGHENMAAALQAGFQSNLVLSDLNNDGHFQDGELGGALGQAFERLDTNQDGILVGTEIHAETLPPEIVYSDTYTVALGGKEVQMIHTAPNHSDDTSVLVFPEERVAHVVDFIAINLIGSRLDGSASIASYVESINQVSELDVDMVIPAHGTRIGTVEDVAMYARFLQDIGDAVAQGIAEGKTIEELQATIYLEDYAHWDNYDSRIEGFIEGVTYLPR